MGLFSFFQSTVDERFLMHRYKLTSHAAMAAGLMMAGWFFYDQIVNSVIRMDYLIVLSVMAVVKVLFMIVYRLTD